LREYSEPFDLRRYGSEWLISKKDLWDIPYDLDRSRHFKILPSGGEKTLRLADQVEIKAGKLIEWQK